MWGSTTPNTADECTWANAPFNGGSNYYDSIYFYDHKSEWLDSKNNLKPEYDAASHIMGGDWRMPTEAEIQELLDNTNSEWIADYDGTGVSGRKFTSKTNGNSIFIPAAGICGNGSVDNVGLYGYVWSSSVSTASFATAWRSYFNSGNCGVNYYGRCYGQSVRGVRK